MAVEALIGSVINALTPFLQQDLSSIFDAFDQELHKLFRSFTIIREVLNDAERKQVRNEPLQVWLQQLKDVAYDIEDILEEWNRKEEEMQHSQVRESYVFIPWCCCCYTDYRYTNVCDPCENAFFCLFKLKIRISMGQRLKKIRLKLDMIFQERTKFGLKEIDWCNDQNDVRVKTASLLDESDPIFGRDDEKEVIISKLINESSREDEDTHHNKLPVLAIIGMGGLGKTTLAQATYNDERVKNHFDIKIWVSIYDDFDVKKITLKILKSVTNITASDCELDLDLLQHRLQETLNERKFLLVFDNVWNQDHMKWEQLRAPLISGERRGSRVIITTRSHRVAEAMGTNFHLDLKELLYDHCWLLFKSRAFDGREIEEHSDLEAIGRKMVKRLKGVPLYAKVLGGVMRSKRRNEVWKELLNNEIWEEEEVANEIFPAFMLSYYDLPSHLKQCFIFCSVFSKDHGIEKEKIIQLWMAHGFIGYHERMDLEEIGERYLNDLVRRSLLQKLDNDKTFKLHDLLHDLAQYVGKNECCIFEWTSLNPTSLTKCRHSTLILSEGDSSIFVTLPKANNLRTLLLLGGHKMKGNSVEAFDKMIFLRALDLSGSSIKKFDGSLAKLIYLRYLNLEGSDVEELHEELKDLWNLQTLNLSDCRNLVSLPYMGYMRSLRYFSVSNCNKLRHSPLGIIRSYSLRHLRFVPLAIRMGDLYRLNNLKSLKIDGLEKVRDEKEAGEAQLKEKKQLRDLDLRWKDWSREELIRLRDDDVARMEKVLDALHPHPNLINSLVIFNFPGCRFPTWISMLTSCTEVTLKKCKELPSSLGLLPSLKSLTVWDCDSVTHVSSSTFSAMGKFPKLEQLHFKSMLKLEEMELRCPSLKHLSIIGIFPKLDFLRYFGMLNL